MINITNENNSVVFYIDDEQVLSFPMNELSVLTEEVSDMVMFKTAKNFKTVVQERWEEITINGEPITKENVVDKFNEIANTNEGGAKINAGTNITLQEEADGSITISATGELGGTVAWGDVTDKPSTFTPSAHNHVVTDITDLQGKLDAKQDTLVSGTNIKTINGQDILGEGNIEIQGGTGDVTKQYVDEQLALKVDKTVYEADKATFALKSEIPSIEGLASKEELQNGLDGKQDKGDYALKSELPDISGLATKAEVDETYAKKTDIPDTSDFATKEELASKADASALSTKQDTLVSGTNIKTINGQTVLGEGNIEIQGGGGGIADAPSDGKKYVRQNANWVEETTVDTSNFATKAELDGKVDDAEIADMLTKTEAASTYQPKGEYLTSIPDEYVTETELSGKGYATTSQLDSKLDVETYNEDKATFATKQELTEGLETKQEKGNYLTVESADGKYQVKGDYATKTELANKVDTSTYNEDKTTFALKTELTDFITVSVDNLVNYYTKSETYTQSEINAKISAITTINFEVVSVLPESGEANKIYLVPNKAQTEQNIKDEYIWIEDKWEIIGSTQIDLSNYYNKGEVDNLVNVKLDTATYNIDKATFALKSELTNLATKQELTEGLETKQDKGDYANRSDLANYLLTVTAEETYQPIGDYATTSQLDAKADKTAIADMLTKTEASETYATKEELPDVSGLATKEELNLKANTSDLSNYVTTVNAEATYAKKSEIPEEYTLPIATSEVLGGIKVGAGLSINHETGVLSATGGGTADAVDWANITSKPETFKPEAHQHVTADVTDLQDKLDAKVDTTAIADMATKTWVTSQGYLTSHQDISNLATKSEVTEGLATKQDKGDYALKSELPDISNLATKDELNLKANSSDLSNYVTTVNAEATYAKKSEIPSLEGYLQTSTADEKYATKTELEGKVDDADIADMLTKTEAASTYQPKGEYLTSIPDEYITETELNGKGYKKIIYITQTEYDELPTKEEGVLYVITDAPEVVIPDTSTFATKNELQAALDRIAALESQIGVLSTQLDNINGEIIN